MIERSIWLYNIFQDVYSFSLLFTLWSQNLVTLKKKNSPRNRKTRTKSPSWRRALSEGKFYRRAFGSIDCPILSEIFPPILGRKVYETFITRITLLFLHVYVGQCTRERRGGQGFSRGINHAMRAIRRKKGSSASIRETSRIVFDSFSKWPRRRPIFLVFGHRYRHLIDSNRG